MKCSLNLFFSVLMSAALLATGTAFAQSNDSNYRRIKLYNNTDTTVKEFYASSINQESWDENFFGDDVLLPGHPAIINFDDGTEDCEYDIKVVLSNKRVHTKSSVDICTVIDIKIQADGIHAN